ncbi:hypothetical protein [Streptomyces sp. NRRL F-2580]|uniref:hypothetical protein n=1 Tax=Streptomyces sp. NRRL F-2580 TaxID=1463841 RepID=UPI00131CC192|nr:hypothetical protein [Streptomyces sp. NRRL F-2580]
MDQDALAKVFLEPLAVVGEQIETEQDRTDPEEPESVDSRRTEVTLGVEAPDEHGGRQQSGDAVEEPDAGQCVNRGRTAGSALLGHGVSLECSRFCGTTGPRERTQTTPNNTNGMAVRVHPEADRPTDRPTRPRPAACATHSAAYA